MGRLLWAENLVRPGGLRSHLVADASEAWCFDRNGDAFALRHGSYIGRLGHPRHSVDIEVAHNAVSRAHARIYRDADAQWRISTAVPHGTLVVDDRVSAGEQGVRLVEGSHIRFSGVVELRFSAQRGLPGQHHRHATDLDTRVPPARFILHGGEIELGVAQIASGPARSRYNVVRGRAEVLLPERLGPLLRALLDARAQDDVHQLDRGEVALQARMSKRYLAVCKRDLRIALGNVGLAEDDLVRRDELRLAPHWRVTRG